MENHKEFEVDPSEKEEYPNQDEEQEIISEFTRWKGTVFSRKLKMKTN